LQIPSGTAHVSRAYWPTEPVHFIPGCNAGTA